MSKKLNILFILLTLIVFINTVVYAQVLNNEGSVGPVVSAETTEAVGNILVYEDSSFPAIVTALSNLGLVATITNSVGDFDTLLPSQSWDLVLINQSNVTTLNNYLDDIENYLIEGGLLVYMTYAMDASPAHSLWTVMGAEWQNNNLSPVPIYKRIPLHAIFTTPNTVPNIVNNTNAAMDNGDYVRVLSNATEVGGSNGTNPNEVLITVRNDCKSILNTFLAYDFQGTDGDTDGKIDVVELWENEITYVANGCGDPLEAIESKLDVLESKLDEFPAVVIRRLKRIKSSLGSLHNKVDALEDKLDSISP